MSQPAAAVLLDLVDRIAADARVDADEASAFRRAVFPGGIVSRGESRAFFTLAGEISDGCDGWAAAVMDAVSDHVLGADNVISNGAAAWLAAHAPFAGALAAPLLVRIVERAESAPHALVAAARGAVSAAVAQSPMGPRETAWVRSCLYALASDEATHVSDAEVRWLFALDAATDGRANDPAWGDLFVKATLNHVTGQRRSALLSPEGQHERRAWLEKPVDPSPVRFFARAFENGLDGYRAGLNAPGETEAFEAHYAQRLTEAAEDERLTLAEVSVFIALVHADGVRTANETRLLEEMRRLEGAQPTRAA
ncbi:MAG: hypothetical protein IV086_18715 [Hyphomonadaceae bacterium]|nr:hypothetical protein [Hyphomonadaceae bacterium]